MAFTSGNDLNVIQASDSAVVGAGAGNDVYVLDTGVLSANQQVQISDTQGVNTLRLVGGLTITSSAIAADTLQLTLSNGAVITVLGASTFSFQTGGNALTGAGSTTQTYSQFVTASLGAAAVPTGNTVVMGTPNTTVNANGGTTVGGGTGGGAGNNLTLTAGVDNRTGTANDDTFDGRDIMGGANAVQTLDQFDTVDGGAGNDRIIVSNNVADIDFTNVRNVEVVSTAGNAVLGTNARAAGITSVNLAGAAGDADIRGFAGDLTVTHGAGNSTVQVNLASAGVKTLNLGAGQDTVNVTPVAGAAVGSVQVNFTSAGIGNGTDQNVTIVNANGNVVVNDEGTTIASTSNTDVFNVIGLGADGKVDPAQNRGNFSSVVLGTSGNDTFTADTNLNVYYNAGAGNDSLTGGSGKDFFVGGDGNDQITTSGGNDTVLAGAGNDGVRDNNTGLVNVNLGAGDDVMRFDEGQFAAANAANTRDTVIAGDGTDTLWLATADINAAKAAEAGQVATVTGFEVIRTGGTLNFKTTDVQAGINSVVLDIASSGNITFEAGARTVQIGAEGLVAGSLNGQAGGALDGNLIITAAGNAANDALTISNGRTTGKVDVFGATNTVTATGYETVALNSGSVATATQVVGVLNVNASAATTATSLTLTGSNAVMGQNNQAFAAVSNTTGMFTVDGSGLAAQAGNLATLRVITTAGNDGTAVVVGSAGNDELRLGSKGSIDGGAGNDTIEGVNSNDTLLGGTGNDTIRTFAGDDRVDAGAGDDVVNVENNLTALDTIAGGDGRDTLVISGNAGVIAVNQANVSGFEILRIEGPLAQDMAQFLSNTTFDTVAINTATAVTVNNASSKITTLRFDTAVDPSAGGGGLVTFGQVNTKADTITLAFTSDSATSVTRGVTTLNIDQADTINLAGRANRVMNDELYVRDFNAADADRIVATTADRFTMENVNLGTEARTVVVDGSAAAQLNFGSNGNFSGGSNTSGPNVSTQVTGTAGNDNIRTSTGRDSINGGDGTDVIFGGQGADTINGGAGNDTYVLNFSGGVADSRIIGTTPVVLNAPINVIETDVVTVTAGDVFDFRAGNADLAVVAVKTAEIAIIGNAPVAAADLLQSLNTAFVANTPANGVDAMLFQYSDGRQFLVVDTSIAPDNVINQEDTIIEIVGAVNTLALNGGNIVIS